MTEQERFNAAYILDHKIYMVPSAWDDGKVIAYAVTLHISKSDWEEINERANRRTEE